MKNIDKTFVDSYLTVGVTYDNYIFEGSPLWVMELARQNLIKTQNENFKAVNITFTKEEEQKLECVFKFCSQEYQKQILANSYFNSKFMLELLKIQVKSYRGYTVDKLQEMISDYLSEDYTRAVNSYHNMPSAFDVTCLIKKCCRIELNIFCYNTQNKYLQMSINDYIASRLPYGIKLFTNTKNLSSYYTSNGQFMQCPHDYLNIDILKYITFDKEKQ